MDLSAAPVRLPGDLRPYLDPREDPARIARENDLRMIRTQLWALCALCARSPEPEMREMVGALKDVWLDYGAGALAGVYED